MDTNDSGHAAGEPAFFVWPLRQTPHMERASLADAGSGRSTAPQGQSQSESGDRRHPQILACPRITGRHRASL